MENPAEPRVRRSQRDYSLPFKLAVIGEVARGELSYKRSQRARASTSAASASGRMSGT